MKGVLVTMPVLESTQTQTLSHLKSRITIDPSSTIMASTNGFSFSIIFSASFPALPTNSGHELFPKSETCKTILIHFFINLSSCRLNNMKKKNLYIKIMFINIVLKIQNLNRHSLCFLN